MNAFSDDPEAILANLPALDVQGGTIFVAGTDRGVAVLLDAEEADALVRLVEAAPAILRALREARALISPRRAPTLPPPRAERDSPP